MRLIPKKPNRMLTFLAVLTCVIFVAIVASVAIATHLSRRQVQATVMHKEHVCNANLSLDTLTCQYLIYTDQGVYTTGSDADYYAEFVGGRRYIFDIYGWHVPSVDAYPYVGSHPVEIPG